MILWQVQNEVVFQNATTSPTASFHRIQSQAEWVRRSQEEFVGMTTLTDSSRYGRESKWNALADGWLKLNCDVAVTNLGANAVAGGVVCNASGGFMFAFAMDLGGSTITVAELRAILASTQLVRRKGLSNIIIEIDSLTAVRLIRGGCSNLHPCYSLVKDIQSNIRMIRGCYVCQTLREANQVTDSLAKFGLGLSSCSRFFPCLPSFLSLSFHADLAGTVFPRDF